MPGKRVTSEGQAAQAEGPVLGTNLLQEGFEEGVCLSITTFYMGCDVAG